MTPDRWEKMKTLIKAGSLLILIYPSIALGFERFDSGDQAFAACEQVVLFEKPTSFSKPMRTIKFGTALKVKGLEKLFELPPTDFSSKAVLESDEEQTAEDEDRDPEPIPPKRYTRAAWLHFDTGYGAASCFVTKDLMDSQTPEEAEKRINALSASKAKRNFSENESGDMTAMRGAAGKAKGGKADYKTMDTLIVSAQGSFDLNAHKSFRREGNLGEFK